MYTVVFDPDVYPMDRAWLSGLASADHLRHTRPEYYAVLRQAVELQSQQQGEPPAPEEKAAGIFPSIKPSEGKER